MDIVKEYDNFVREKGDALSRYLGRAQIRLIDKLRLELSQSEGPELSLSQFHCLQFLCLKGISQKDLAKKLGVTKQAMNQAINDLEEKGLIFKVKDPFDSRIKIIRHTSNGRKVVAKIISATMKIENEIIDLVGERNFKNLKKSLSKIELMD